MWFPLKIKISKEDEIREKSISECIICLLPQRTVHCCSALTSHTVLGSDCILNETALLSSVSNNIFVVTHKDTGFHFWFHRKSLRAFRSPNFSTSRRNLLGQNEPGKDFPATREGRCHLRLAYGAVSGSGILVLAGYFPVHSMGKR